MLFEKLYHIVEKEMFSLKRNLSSKDIHSFLIQNPHIREILEIELPPIEDITEILKTQRGKVFAVRMDKSCGIIGFKKITIASLILKRIIEDVRRKTINNRWIDGGNVNSCLALAYYANKFNGESAYVMSRFFPDYVIEYIKDIVNNSIKIVKAPNLSLGIERDFYKYLVNLIRSDEKYRTYQPLWHAKYSGKFSEFLGNEIANAMNFIPDYIVVGIGAGATLEGQAIPIKSKFHNKPKIIVPEHILSPLLNTGKPVINIYNKNFEIDDWFSKPPEGIPHYILGPHYDEINPLLRTEILNSVDQVYRYDDNTWQEISYKCYNSGFEIGNSSAANLAIAKHIVEKNNSTVLTFIYEPFRSIYKGQNLYDNNTIQEGLLT